MGTHLRSQARANVWEQSETVHLKYCSGALSSAECLVGTWELVSETDSRDLVADEGDDMSRWPNTAV